MSIQVQGVFFQKDHMYSRTNHKRAPCGQAIKSVCKISAIQGKLYSRNQWIIGLSPEIQIFTDSHIVTQQSRFVEAQPGFKIIERLGYIDFSIRYKQCIDDTAGQG